MNKVNILCEKDRIMMYEFSRMSLNRMQDRSPQIGMHSFFSAYNESNVKKEVDKDRLIIEEAARAYEAGRPACDLDLEDIFEKTKAIDKVFLSSLLIPSFALTVRYSDFADIRIQRIWRISRTVYALLTHWPVEASFSEAVKNAYTGNKFKEIISEILQLYSQETRMLGKSIRTFGPFTKALSSYAESLFHDMENVTEDIAKLYTQRIFGDQTVHA